MRLLFLSDTHLGFGRKHKDYPERREDAFVGARNALSLAAEHGIQLILHGGDLFDSLRPSFQTLREVVELLTSLPEGDARVRVEDWQGNLIYEKEFERIPFVAVHGNHDWNQNRENNLYTLLEKAGLLVYAHRRRVYVEADGERVCIVGIGWIPDRYVSEVYGRAPSPGCDSPAYFLFHQPVKGLYPVNPREYLVPASQFPSGYTLYLGGHLHWIVDKRIGEKRFLIPGSTVITKLKDGEMDRPRIVYLIEGESVTPLEIPGVRRAYQVEGTELEEIKEKIDSLLAHHNGPTPIVKVVLEGRSSEGVDEDVLRKIYKGRAMIYLYDRREDDFFRRIRSIKGEISSDAFTRDFVLELLRKKMGEDWEPWMEVFMLRIFEGKDEENLLRFLEGLDVGEVSKERAVKGSGGILDWVE